MHEFVTPAIMPPTNAETKAAITEMLREVRSNREQMRLDREVADEMKRATRAVLAELEKLAA